MNGYQETFERILIDSGAFSEFSTGKKIDIDAYADWSEKWVLHADAIAGLDDISGDWRKSLRNYEKFPKGFPTFHETDPPELLKDLITISQERNQWIGLGLIPPRGNKEYFIRSTLEKIPNNIHVHGWALREYTKYRKISSVDSTNWWRDAYAIKSMKETSHLTYSECLEIVIKRYKRWSRKIDDSMKDKTLFDNIGEL
jgi:hypothetical protein